WSRTSSSLASAGASARVRRVRMLVLVADTVLVIVPAASGGSAGPCSLVTADGAGKALGVKVGTGMAQTLGRYNPCTYTNARKPLAVRVRKNDDRTVEKRDKKNPPPVYPTPGIRDEAFSAGAGAALLVWKNGTEVTFPFVGVSPVVQTQKDV